MGETIEIKRCRSRSVFDGSVFENRVKNTPDVQKQCIHRYRHTKRQSDEVDRNGIILDFILLETARRLRAGNIAWHLLPI